MLRVVAVRLIVLVYALLRVAGQQSCLDDAPDNCEFTNTSSCGWILGGAIKFKRHGSDWSVALGGIKEAKGNMTSRTACPTEGREHCLEFRYLFERNNILELNVYIQEIGGEGHLVWREDGSNQTSWEQAKVSVNTTYNFTVVCEMKRLYTTTVGQSVLINSIHYTRFPCGQSSVTTEPSPSTTSRDTSPPDTPNNTGVIVGIVVGVLIFVAVAVLVLIFCRRKQFSFASPSATHSSGNNNTNNTTSGSRAHCYSAYANHELDNPATQPNDTNLQAQSCQDAEPSSRDVSGPKYTVNKSKKGRQPELPAVSMSSDDNPYEIVERGASVMHYTSMHQPKKIEHAEPYLGNANSDGKNIKNTGKHTAGTEMSEDDAYNRLNRNGGQENKQDDLASSSATQSFDAEYNHLKASADCTTFSINDDLGEQNPRNPEVLDDSTTERSLRFRMENGEYNGEYNVLEFDKEKSRETVAGIAIEVAPSGGEYNHLTLGTACTTFL